MDIISKAADDIPLSSNRYLTRGTDSTIVGNSEIINAYTKLPDFIFWSCITPLTTADWKKTTIKKEGEIGPPQEVNDKKFGGFLWARIEKTEELFSKLSKKQQKLIDETVIAIDPDLKKKSAESWIEDMKRMKE
ncbi:MAG TPA: hypothetical protein VN963_07175 [bacterium]|nr:hypothetical protein [bacterium]